MAINGAVLLCKGLSISVIAAMSLAISLIKFLRFLNEPSESLQKWDAILTDQLLCKNTHDEQFGPFNNEFKTCSQHNSNSISKWKTSNKGTRI